MIWAWFLLIFVFCWAHMAEDFRYFSQLHPFFFFFRTPKLSSSCHGGFQWFSSSRHLRQFWTQYRQVIHSHGCLGPKSALLVIHQVEKMEVGNGWYMMVDLYGIYICMVNKWIIYQYIKQCIYIYWLVVSNMTFIFHNWEFHHSKWRSPSFFRVGWNHQPGGVL